MLVRARGRRAERAPPPRCYIAPATRAAVAVFAAALGASTAHAGTQLTAMLDRASVTFHVPGHVAPGGSPVIALRVRPAGAAPPPVRVRARLGMPHHGRWITDEAAHPYAESALAFRGERCAGDAAPPPGVLCLAGHDVLIPKYGRYRLRVWLDYGDGHVEKTGVEVDVVPGRRSEARVMR